MLSTQDNTNVQRVELLQECFYREIKPINQTLRMQNKWNSFVKDGTFPQIS